MNDPYKSQRIELCKQQTMLHNANCVNCVKMVGEYDAAVRMNACKKCHIGEELGEIGGEFIKYARPRKKMPKIRFDDEPQNKKILYESKIEPYLMLRKSGLSHKDIAGRWGCSTSAIQKFAKKFNLETPAVKKESKLEIPTLEQYLELKRIHKSDRQIVFATNFSRFSINKAKRIYGLIKGAV